ncbi:hypothetical protein TWF225_006135 [Orbilia oligospora]|nr:hypothetical protein TWF225_006135 [Orbilia oligospora]KAF3247533.1 hypothetical protein TWF128_008610 [Orbilia oligospora]KAF3247534.1 hypothetical protein TWF128_008610 [Orbilia oligospora]KAF3250835.1 hypothetical protein TWF217_008448 [Orbilia oligospora]
MGPEQNDAPLSPTAGPDINSRFQAGMRDSRAKIACQHCRWTGSNLPRHMAEEHGSPVIRQETADDSKPSNFTAAAAAAAPASFGPQEQTEDSMQIDETSAVSSTTPAAAPTARPPRRKPVASGGRRVDSVDPDFVRSPRRGGSQVAGGGRLYDPRSDSIKPSAQSSSRPTQAQRTQVPSPSSPRTAPRPSNQTSRNPIPPSTGPNALIIKKQPVDAPVPAITTTTAATTTRSPPPQGSTSLSSLPIVQNSSDADESEPQQPTELILQPETRPISQEQLVAEVKGIYAGLVMVEAKCIEVDSKQAAAATQGIKQVPPLNNDQWQALIALHRTLLHEHHDFFLASQHPSAAPSLRKLATKYAMPARMWRHGIHSFLELLRHRLPESFEHMLAFIYLAYSMMALLYETVPAFADTWVECLGDLGRYRMAIEEGDPRDREVWMHVSRFWYSKGTDRQPHVGRLYHHLAILARPNILQQLFFYCKALAVAQPFSAARESILTLFDPTALKEQDVEGNQSADAVFVLLHSICFTVVNQDAFAEKKDEYLELLDKKITVSKLKFKVPGVYIAICGIASLFQYNLKDGRMKLATTAKENQKATADAEAAYKNTIQNNPEKENLLPPGPVIDGYNPKDALLTQPPDLDPSVSFDISLTHAQELAFDILSLFFDRGNDAAVQPHIHVWLVFLDYLKHYPEGMALVVKTFPWEKLAEYGTALLKKNKNNESILEKIQASGTFPVAQKGIRPLPEEYMMRGLESARRYFPYGYFSKMVDDDERLIELPSMGAVREEKMLWLMVRFANYGPWIQFDPVRCSFSVSNELKALLHNYTAQPTDTYEPSSIMEEDDSDVEMDMSSATMADDEEESFDEIENPELTQLLAQRRELRKQLNDPIPTVEQEKKAKKSDTFSSESFKPDVTTVVVDTNSLVKYLDIFKKMLEGNQWSIVLPYSVVTELQGLQRNEGKISETSQQALTLINQALVEKRKLRVVTAKQSAITNVSSQFKELIDDYSEEGRKNLDDIIIETAKAQGEISAKRFNLNDANNELRPVVLITDDAVMRVKAITRGVASVGTKQWVKYISPPDADTQRRIANTYLSLVMKHPRLDKDRVYKAAQEARGDESGATSLLRRDMSMKKRRARAQMERYRQHGVPG